MEGSVVAGAVAFDWLDFQARQKRQARGALDARRIHRIQAALEMMAGRVKPY